MADLDEVEPRLRAIAHAEIDTASMAVDETVSAILSQVCG
jgi:hypothetical protein